MKQTSKKILITLGIFFSIILLAKFIISKQPTATKKIAISKVTNGCLSCHQQKDNRQDQKTSHFNHLKLINCTDCHLGQPSELVNKEQAHKDLIKLPGNTRDAKKTCGKCNQETTAHVLNSLMNTGHGMVSVNRFVFGESKTLDSLVSLESLSNSHADNHLKQLCKSCHLGTPKESFGPINEGSRGGGCLACHLDENSFSESNHARLTIQVKNHNCFGCHSRSSRISTSYEGWHEFNQEKKEENTQYRTLADGRVFEKKQADVHHQLGFQCIDCHTARGVMGDGNKYFHQEDQVEISCKDCHFSQAPKTVSYKMLDAQSKRILRLRGIKEKQKRKHALSSKKNKPLINIYKNSQNDFIFQQKITHKEIKLSPLNKNCQKNQKQHQRLNCISCHSAWAPQCVSCHTQLDLNKKWVEFSGDFLSDAPSLGIIVKNKKEVITTFVPGMIMTLSKTPTDTRKLKDPTKTKDTTFHRLFSPIVPHTISKEPRSCKSCHQNPNALGFGRGKISFDGENASSWVFSPTFYELQDGLPADSWIPFLGSRAVKSETRTNARPFSIAEQKKILKVGRCLTCHSCVNDDCKIFDNYNESLKSMHQKHRQKP